MATSTRAVDGGQVETNTVEHDKSENVRPESGEETRQSSVRGSGTSTTPPQSGRRLPPVHSPQLEVGKERMVERNHHKTTFLKPVHSRSTPHGGGGLPCSLLTCELT